MKPSYNAIQAIKNREKCKLTAYRLKGEDYDTIGWGHLIDKTSPLYGTGIKKITQAYADSLLVRDVTNKTSVLNSVIKTAIPQNLYDALVSTVYQYNPSNKSIQAILRAVNLGYEVTQIAKMLISLPSNSYNLKARKVDALLATTGKLQHIDKIRT